MSIRIDGTNTTANPGITGSDTDTGLQFGTNEVKVVTDGSDRVTVDSSGNIGVGVTPSSWGGSRNAIQFDSAGAAYVCNDSTVGIVSNMYFDGSNNKYINAGTASTAYFQQDNVVFQFAPSGSADGNGTFTTSTRIDADGVKFGSDTAAANALSDYEEGTWTPTAGAGATGISVDTNNCVYVKVGNLVTLHFEIYYPTGLSATTFKITGVPFQIDEESLGQVMLNSVDFPSNRTMVTLYGNNSELRLYASGNGQNWQDLHGTDVTTDASIIGTITYRST